MSVYALMMMTAMLCTAPGEEVCTCIWRGHYPTCGALHQAKDGVDTKLPGTGFTFLPFIVCRQSTWCVYIHTHIYTDTTQNV